MHDRAVNNDLLDSYQLKSMDAVLEVPVERMKIRRRDGRHHVYVDTGTRLAYSRSANLTPPDEDSSPTTPADYDNFALREPYDRVIRCLGFEFNETLFSQ